MSFKTWVYHATEEPKIIDSDDLDSHLEDGWAESPIGFIKTTDFGIDPTDCMGVQALGESIQGVADSMNGQLNLDEMRPKDLKEYANTHYGMEIKGNREKLLKQVKALCNDNSGGNNH